jgi:hypothetical protein
MKRIFFSWLAVTFAALSANALANVSVTHTGTALPGNTITLEVRVTVSPGDGNDTSLFGALVYPTSGIGPVTPGTQNALAGTTFAPGPLSCNTSRCVMFSQTSGLAGPQPGNVTNFLISSQNYTILPGFEGVLQWRWQTSPSTQQVDFFNFNNAVAPVPALAITIIPEPTTAALLGLGLLGLAAARRRK